MAKIQYSTYQFNRPSILAQSDYNALKELLSIKPNYNLNPPSNFLNTFKFELIILGSGVLGFLLLSLEPADWLILVGGIPVFVAFFSLFSIVPSLISFYGFVWEKAHYYSILKSDIIKSKNYTDFLNLRNGR